MRISFNWLKNYVDVDVSAEDLAQRLTSVGLEVESVEHLGEVFTGFVVGEVLSAVKHPKADKLSLCDVVVKSDPEKEILRIVCGAPNVASGQKVPVARVGAFVPHNQHDPKGEGFSISPVKIRGEQSNGMICSEYELGIGGDKDGILVLPSDAVVGQPLAEHFGLNDTVLEIGITPNRPDCLSHLGVAKEVAAILKKKLTLPAVKARTVLESDLKDIRIKIENIKSCPRYSAAVIHTIVVSESPDWLQKFLKSVGIRPINNIVDVTNFVMMEYGQPLHAFDYEMISGKTVVVKDAVAGDQFRTLDGIQRSLSDTDLMICDAERSIAVGGVMGGQNSEITGTTKSLLLESAYFSPTSIRRTSKRLGISTDASFRFERGVDPNGTLLALQRAVDLILEVSPGAIAGNIIDKYPAPIQPLTLQLRGAKVNSILGTTISLREIDELLSSIGIVSQQKGDGVLTCRVPTFRPDIQQEIDLIEEVARLYGFHNIDDKISSTLAFSFSPVQPSAEDILREWLVANGFNEIISNSLLDESTASLFSNNLVMILNPISKDQSVLRPNLLPSMLQAINYNCNHGTTDLRLFEFGRTFVLHNSDDQSDFVKGYKERNLLGICITGNAYPPSWYSKGRAVDIFDMKGIIRSITEKITLDKFRFIYYDKQDSLTEQRISLEINDTYVGYLAQVSKRVLSSLKMEGDIFVAEIDLDAVKLYSSATKKYQVISKYPSVNRDLAFVVSRSVKVEDIEECIKNVSSHLLQRITLFDVFESKTLGDEKKSVAFSMTIAASDRTLTDSEVDELVNKVIEQVQGKFQAVLRSL